MIQPKKRTYLEYWFALASVEGLGGVRIKRLITRFGDVANIFDAELPEIARLPSFNPVLASRILTVAQNFPVLRERLDALNSQQVEVLCPEDAAYPAQLKAVPDAPPILCRIGTVTEIREQCVAIVGSQQPSLEGIQVTLALAVKLAQAGFTVVSGLATGIDATAHNGALAVGGRTVGVLATDFSVVYPFRNSQLAAKIYETGCLFTEHPFPTSPSPGNFVLRNRIISGLSVATIVVESQKSGGAMHTARYARRQGKHVFACRWKTRNERSEGTLELINTGAIPFLPNELDKVVEGVTHPELLEAQSAIGASGEQMALFDAG